MAAPCPPIERVVIAGGGTAGWMAAALLAKTLGPRLRICLVESAQIGAIGVGEATIPPIRLFNDALGLDEHDLLRRTGGTYKLGIEFRGWGRLGDCYMHAFGDIGRDLGMGPFHQYWLRSLREGNDDRLWDYFVNERAALAGRFDPAEQLPGSPLAGIQYAFHFDASRYALYLRAFSERLGVERIEGNILQAGRRPADGLIQALAEPKLLKFVTGRRERFWQGNCVALGLAAGFLEPLESTSIHLIQRGISRLLHLFPDQGFAPATIDEYNRQSLFEFDRIRDFLILHYKATERDDSAFWRACRELPAPESLLHRLALFRAGGWVCRDLGELFTEAAWLQVMLGQNVQPQSHHPVADVLSRTQLKRYLRDLKTIIRGAVARMPEHEAYVRSHCAAEPQGDDQTEAFALS